MKSENNIPYRNLDYIENNELPFEIQHFIKRKNDKMESTDENPHRHNFYILSFVNEAIGGGSVDFQKYYSKKTVKKVVMLIRPEQVHISGKIVYADTVLLRFTRDFLQSDKYPLLDENQNINLINLKPDDYDSIYSLVMKIYDEFYSAGEWKFEIIQSYLNTILVLLSRAFIRSAPLNKKKNISDSLVTRFQKLVNEKFISMRKVEKYAELLFVSSGHLNDSVKDNTGKTAKEIISERISLEAKRLLYYNDNSIKEISDLLEFNDVAYFSRFFKNITGLSPQDFRSKFRKKSN